MATTPFKQHRQFNLRLPLLLPALLLGMLIGCADSSEELVDFNSLPKTSDADVAIADAANGSGSDAGLNTTDGPTPTDVNDPPAQDDPFANNTQDETNASVAATDNPSNDNTTTQDGSTNSTGDDSTSDQPATERKELTPLERMMRMRAVAIAKANGTEIPTFDDEEDTGPREIKLLVKERKFRKGPQESVRVSFDDLDLLRVLNMAPVPTDAADHFPEWLSGLHGKKICLRGFMYPPSRGTTDLMKFRMARDNDICCFVRTPKIYDTCRVTMKKDNPTDFIDGHPFDVVGTFRITPEAEFGELFELWRIENAIIIDR